jgi:hypothetical protein
VYIVYIAPSTCAHCIHRHRDIGATTILAGPALCAPDTHFLLPESKFKSFCTSEMLRICREGL